MKKKAVLLYSGGKDSHYALYTAINYGYDVPFVINIEPFPHYKGYIYFNNPYSKEMINAHSNLMGIKIAYFKMDKNKYNIFKNDMPFFLLELISFIKKRLEKFTFFFTWDRDDLVAEPNHQKQYKIITSFLRQNKQDFLFPFANKSFRIISNEYSMAGIKPICIGITKKNIVFKNILGMVMNLEFVEKIEKENENLPLNMRITKPDMQSVVIESPLFKNRKIKPVLFKEIETEENLFLKIRKYKIER